MIDFACKRFDLGEVIKCSLGLTRAEYAVFLHATRHAGERFVTEDTAASLSLDLSTVQRAVKKLHGHGVLLRHQVNLDGGGYVFEYVSAPKPEIRRIVMRVVHGWAARVEGELNAWSPG